jgi:uncharacterized lipoprotein YddW (UPF0748 family)
MRLRRRLVTLCCVVLAVLGGVFAATNAHAAPRNGGSVAPPLAREFRGVWVATVENIDWPSKRGLSTEQQKREMIAILDKCVELNLNAVIFQVRTQADALYASKLEPWSEYLTGHMGQPPEPYYDPLAFAVEEAHRRGLQLHVWFNPYRVRVPSAKGEASPEHVSVAHPEVVRSYGKYKWFDPGEPAAEEQFIAVLKDVITRYDVDGVHIDDYFYPYQETDAAGKIIPFPDDETYKRSGTKLKRDDWRRENVNHLIERMYKEVKKAKPYVLVGISPFGIWRPGNPPGIAGFDQYASLYADARKWEQEGWLDYLTPQLYWKVDSEKQSYPKLLAWWAEQNSKQRHLWPGNFTSKIGGRSRTAKSEKPDRAWTAEDIIRQIEVTRATPGATGNVHFSMKALMKNSGGIADKLKRGLYAEPALVPESRWLGKEVPAKPKVSAKRTDDGVAVQINAGRGEAPWQWVVQAKTSDGWISKVVPGRQSDPTISLPSGAKPERITVSGVSSLGREGEAAQVKAEKRD